MRELKKVTVNVANVELYCTEKCDLYNKTKLNHNRGHKCPTAAEIEKANNSNGMFDMYDELYCAKVNTYAHGFYESDYYCKKSDSNYAHYLINGSVYCVEFYRVDGVIYAR